MRTFTATLVAALVFGSHAPGQAAEAPAANPELAALPDNTALDLGAYRCAERMPQIAERCRTITDFSRFNYDPYGHRILMFGGGHAATGRTDVDAFDLETLAWNSLYPSMSCDEVAARELDPLGFHTRTGHPLARHTYDMSVIATVAGEGRLLLLSTEGFAGNCHRYNGGISSIAAFPLTPGAPARWHYSPRLRIPWHYYAAAEFDPVSGMVIVIGARSGAGEGGMWVYDPAQEQVVTFVDGVEYQGYDSNLVYHPPSQRMFLIGRGAPNTIRAVQLKRDDWAASRSRLLEPGGTAPSTGATGWAYDSSTGLLGGAVVGGVFHTYDPDADQWAARRIQVRSNSGAPVGDLTFHMLDYDPVNNVFVWISDGEGGRRTWAYRFRGR